MNPAGQILDFKFLGKVNISGFQKSCVLGLLRVRLKFIAKIFNTVGVIGA